MEIKPVLAVSVFARNPRGEILLVKRGRAPALHKWAFPGGRVEPGESLDAAAARELAEETGLFAEKLAFLRELDLPSRDAQGRLVSHFVLSVFKAVAEGEPVAGDDAAHAGWYGVADALALDLTDSVREFIAPLTAS